MRTEPGRESPLVSVVIPAKDASETIDEALASVTSQVHLGWEALVIDDGSVDATLARAQSWAARDARIRVLRHADGLNHGRGATRNLGVKESRGEIVAFLDADDRLEPEALSTFVEEFRRFPNAGVVYGRARVWRDGVAGEMIGRGESESPKFMFRQLARFNVLVTSATAARREALGTEPFPVNMPLAQDWACWLEVARRWPFVFVNRHLGWYRIHGKSGTAEMVARSDQAAYELAQARFLQELLISSSLQEAAMVRTGLVFRSSSAAQRACSLLLRGHARTGLLWLSASIKISGSARIFGAALARVWPEQIRVWKGGDPPLTTYPA
jgi:cellulose synthase/poly-beta-1,6-N-acetylglucosamine synthase-like glycosyltransferase